MPPLFKRIFGQGKSKASNTLVALCIGDHSRITLPIEGKEAHQLQALLAHEAAADESSPSTSQPAQSKSNGLGPQTSFRGFRHLLQHFGSGAASASSQDGAEVDSQQQLTQFLKNLGGYPSVSFVTAADDGLVSRDKVLAKLTKLFKQSTAPVVLVSYCGPSDERGNWRLASQVPVGGAAAAAAGGTAAAAAGTCVLSFREVSMLWQRYRKHSQRLVLLLDCVNSGYWVSALRMLSKAEQLELSLGVQASDCSLPATQGMQLTYQPGIFIQFFLVNNKWRRDSRRNGGGGTAQQAALAVANGSVSGSVAGAVRGEHWLPGMLPSYYATWLNDNLVDYRIALRFFNTELNSLSSGSASVSGRTAVAAAAGGQTSPSGGGGGEDQAGGANYCDPSFPMSPMGAAILHNRAWRASTGPLAAISSSKLLGGPSGLGSDLTSPSSEAWCSPRSVGGGGGGGGPHSKGPESEADARERNSLDHTAVQSTMAPRAVSLQDSARRRFATPYYDNCTTDGAGSATATVGSPNTPTMQRVRISTPQVEFRGAITSPSVFGPDRSPTLPGDDSLYKMAHEIDGSVTTTSHTASQQFASNVLSPSASASASAYGDIGSGAIPIGGGSRLQGRSSGAVFYGVAVHPVAVEVTDYSRASAGEGGGGDDFLVVQPSAQSDTVAVAWDRRSTHAERCLVEGNGGITTSFTNPVGHQGGFANELFGALHEVATERRLRARRAPLGGDESLDAMMEDDDLERRASVASLPSAMLPRDMILNRGQAGAGGAGGRFDSSGGSICGVASVGGVIAAPRTSALLGLAMSAGQMGEAGPGAGAAGSDRPSSITQRRNGSRLFMMSVASRISVGQLSAGQMDELAEDGADGDGDVLSLTASFDRTEEGGEEEGEEEAGAQAMQGSPSAGPVAPAQRRPTAYDDDKAQAAADGGGGVNGMYRVAMDLLESRGWSDLPASSAAAGAPVSLEWPQPALSLEPSPAVRVLPSGHDLCRGGSGGVASGTSGAILRSLLRQHVSIADSMDLDSVSISGQPAWQRRPGRFEMAGSESSSFVFGDDKERFDVLRMLRGQGGEEEAAQQEQQQQAAALTMAADYSGGGSGGGDAGVRGGEYGGGTQVTAGATAPSGGAGDMEGAEVCREDILLSMECAGGS